MSSGEHSSTVLTNGLVYSYSALLQKRKMRHNRFFTTPTEPPSGVSGGQKSPNVL